MSDIFSDFSHTKKEIYKKIKEAVIASVNESCEDSIATVLDYDIKNNEDTSDNTVSFSLNKEGVNILSFGLSQAEANCEPRGVLIPYGDFGKNVSPKFLELLHGV